jgi:hypothetical protein
MSCPKVAANSYRMRMPLTPSTCAVPEYPRETESEPAAAGAKPPVEHV